jgi:hypothetical protein
VAAGGTLADVFHSIELEQPLLLRRYFPLSPFSSQTIRPAQGFFLPAHLIINLRLVCSSSTS